jgi:hypothetical protein
LTVSHGHQVAERGINSANHRSDDALGRAQLGCVAVNA